MYGGNCNCYCRHKTVKKKTKEVVNGVIDSIFSMVGGGDGTGINEINLGLQKTPQVCGRRCNEADYIYLRCS